jgi:hypothetical protein
MIDFLVHNEIARQRSEALLADAERHRLARSMRVQNAERQSMSQKNGFAAFFQRRRSKLCRGEV